MFFYINVRCDLLMCASVIKGVTKCIVVLAADCITSICPRLGFSIKPVISQPFGSIYYLKRGEKWDSKQEIRG